MAATVAGHTVIRELARGGLGVIYLAHHPLLHADRAIKRPLSLEGLEHDLILARFRREVQAVGAIRHEHIVTVHDAGVDAAGPFLVMEYLDGVSLAAYVRSRALGIGEACEVIRQAALGLQCAHESGLVHRDIKPSNLMLARTRNGARVVIIDWGLVKRKSEGGNAVGLGAITGTGIGLGTSDYIAPEQIANARAVDIRADIYSLGITLYVLLSGRVPYPNRSDLEKLLAHHRGEPYPPVEQLVPQIPADLAEVVCKMMAHDPNSRYPDPGSVADELGRFTQGVGSAQLGVLLGHTPTQEYKVDPTQPPDERTPVAEPGNTRTFRLEERTTSSDSPRGRTRWRRWVVILAVLLLLGGDILVVYLIHVRNTQSTQEPAEPVPVPPPPPYVQPPKDMEPKKTKPLAAPVVRMKTDLAEAIQKKLLLPEGWSDGDAFRVVKTKDGTVFLECSKLGGMHLVTLPPVGLTGDFGIECSCVLPHGFGGMDASSVQFRLVNRQKAIEVPITLASHGEITISEERHQPPQDFKPAQPLKVTIRRTKNQLQVWLDDNVGASKMLSPGMEFDTVRLGMMQRRLSPQVYSLNVWWNTPVSP